MYNNLAYDGHPSILYANFFLKYIRASLSQKSTTLNFVDYLGKYFYIFLMYGILYMMVTLLTFTDSLVRLLMPNYDKVVPFSHI